MKPQLGKTNGQREYSTHQQHTMLFGWRWQRVFRIQT